LPIALAIIIGLIVWFVLVPYLAVLFKQAQLSNNTAVPFPHLPNGTLIKTPVIDECAHGTNNQTLDSGILCLPNDTKLMEKYIDGQHRQI
jgi:hypothetical protein